MMSPSPLTGRLRLWRSFNRHCEMSILGSFSGRGDIPEFDLIVVWEPGTAREDPNRREGLHIGRPGVFSKQPQYTVKICPNVEKD